MHIFLRRGRPRAVIAGGTHADDRGLMHGDVPRPAPGLTHGVDYCMHSIFIEHIPREYVA